MKRLVIMAMCAICTITVVDARIWRVNNTVGANADFNTISAAIAAASIGDTLHVESSPSDYGSLNLNKKLVIRGTGYFLNEPVSNPKTQYKKDVAYCSSGTFNTGSKGSIVEGLSFNSVNIYDSLITFQRNYVSGTLNLGQVKDIAGDTIRQNFLSNGIYLNSGGFKTRGLFMYNNIILGQISIVQSLVNNVDGYAINNSFLGNNNFICANFVFQNNIFNNSNFTTNQSANVFLNNVSADGNLPSGNGNIRNAPLANVFVGGTTGTGYSSDGRYQLKAGSPAIGAGLLNGMPVDCGAFGGPAPYALSGMPQMPSIYDISMPTQINVGTGSINISISAAAH